MTDLRNEWKLTLPFPPSVNTYWRTGKGRQYINEKAVKYTRAVNELIQQQNLAVNLSKKLSVTIYAAPPDNRRRDIDNLAKGVLDALTKARFWADDNQVDHLTIRRCAKVKGGCIYLFIREKGEELPDINDIAGEL